MQIQRQQNIFCTSEGQDYWRSRTDWLSTWRLIDLSTFRKNWTNHKMEKNVFSLFTVYLHCLLWTDGPVLDWPGPNVRFASNGHRSWKIIVIFSKRSQVLVNDCHFLSFFFFIHEFTLLPALKRVAAVARLADIHWNDYSFWKIIPFWP